MLLRKQSLAIFLLISGNHYAQSNTVATGGNSTGINGSVSYSIGQIDYTSQSGTNGQLNQGVQQPYEFYSTNSIDELGDQIQLTIGPNPTTDGITVTYLGTDTKTLECTLTDASGKVVIAPFNFSQQTILDLNPFASGMYNLSIHSGAKEIKTVKIIKN